MRKLAVIGVVVAALVAAGSAAAADVSSNWGGYALVAADPSAAPLAFSDVTGTWVEPKATCTSGRRDASAFWVGLGGYADSSTALEQLGTSAECDGSSAKAVHYAWWELVPAPSVRIPLKIYAGDTVTAAVVVNGQRVTFFLKDVTHGTRFSKTVTAKQPLDVTSAEWIAEAPSECSPGGHCRVVPLTNFGTLTFSNAAAISNGHPGTLTDTTWSASPIELITKTDGFFGSGDVLGPGVGAVPGDVSSDGRSFSVSWQRGLTG
ncbi:MAG TPA: G1 family glutamic endopeptidase [Gaiellaceae bacterium]